MRANLIVEDCLGSNSSYLCYSYVVIHVVNKMSERKKSCISQWNVINNFLSSQSFFLFSDFILIVGTYQNLNLWRTWTVCCNSTTIRVVWWLNCVVLRCQNKTPEYKKKKNRVAQCNSNRHSWFPFKFFLMN